MDMQLIHFYCLNSNQLSTEPCANTSLICKGKLSELWKIYKLFFSVNQKPKIDSRIFCVFFFKKTIIMEQLYNTQVMVLEKYMNKIRN